MRYDLGCAWMRPKTEPPLPCRCKFSDAWRCAKADNRRDVVACGCPCHRPPTVGTQGEGVA